MFDHLHLFPVPASQVFPKAQALPVTAGDAQWVHREPSQTAALPRPPPLSSQLSGGGDATSAEPQALRRGLHTALLQGLTAPSATRGPGAQPRQRLAQRPLPLCLGGWRQSPGGLGEAHSPAEARDQGTGEGGGGRGAAAPIQQRPPPSPGRQGAGRAR